MSTRVAFVLWLKCCLSLRSWWRDHRTCTLSFLQVTPYLIWRWHARCLASHCKLTHWPLGDLDSLWKVLFSILFYWLVSSQLLMIMPSDECHGTYLSEDKSTLVQVMAWCHYLSQFWPRPPSPYGVTRAQWVNRPNPDPMNHCFTTRFTVNCGSKSKGAPE